MTFFLILFMHFILNITFISHYYFKYYYVQIGQIIIFLLIMCFFFFNIKIFMFPIITAVKKINQSTFLY